MWSSRNVLDSLLWEAAHDDMGIYPLATIRDGVEMPRTQWQAGWNAAVMGMAKKHGQLSEWARALPADHADMLREMLDADDEPVGLRVGGEAIGLRIMCGDTFAYACADSEEFELADLPDVYRQWKAHGYCGLIAWIARKRRHEPVKEYRYSAGYLAAKADLSLVEPQQSSDAVDPHVSNTGNPSTRD